MPARGPSIDRDRLRELFDEGLPYDEIAKRLGASYSGVAHAVKRMGLSRTQLEHPALRTGVPIAEEHKRAAPLQYMRELSQMSQGKMISAHRQATAIRWAEELGEEGLDVSYAPDAPPSDFCPQGGFYTVPAGEGMYDVAALLQAAQQTVNQ
ncbi:hypothetical protein [Nonomuraea rubra]|uniref:hypothetical protein n=1 Tax=Nonomuraea rubra TaxID=46180 RepID=UPI0033C07386